MHGLIKVSRGVQNVFVTISTQNKVCTDFYMPLEVFGIIRNVKNVVEMLVSENRESL